MSRKDLMKMIALATGISVAGVPSGATSIDPEFEDEFRPATGTQDTEGFGGASGEESPFGGY